MFVFMHQQAILWTWAAYDNYDPEAVSGGSATQDHSAFEDRYLWSQASISNPLKNLNYEKHLHNLFISSLIHRIAVTSCGNDWLDLAPSTQVRYRNEYQCLCPTLIIHIERHLLRQCVSADAYSGRLVYLLRRCNRR